MTNRYFTSILNDEDTYSSPLCMQTNFPCLTDPHTISADPYHAYHINLHTTFQRQDDNYNGSENIRYYHLPSIEATSAVSKQKPINFHNPNIGMDNSHPRFHSQTNPSTQQRYNYQKKPSDESSVSHQTYYQQQYNEIQLPKMIYLKPNQMSQSTPNLTPHNAPSEQGMIGCNTHLSKKCPIQQPNLKSNQTAQQPPNHAALQIDYLAPLAIYDQSEQPCEILECQEDQQVPMDYQLDKWSQTYSHSIIEKQEHEDEDNEDEESLENSSSVPKKPNFACGGGMHTQQTREKTSWPCRNGRTSKYKQCRHRNIFKNFGNIFRKFLAYHTHFTSKALSWFQDQPNQLHMFQVWIKKEIRFENKKDFIEAWTLYRNEDQVKRSFKLLLRELSKDFFQDYILIYLLNSKLQDLEIHLHSVGPCLAAINQPSILSKFKPI